MRPVPAAKRQLSDGTLLPHLVQVLLTFDPALVERTAKLLFIIVQVRSASIFDSDLRLTLAIG